MKFLELNGLKVIFMLGCLEVGGAEQQALLLACWLKERCGVHVEIWGVDHAGELSARCEALGIPWRVVGNPLTGNIRTVALKLVKLAWRLRQAGADLLLPYTLVPNVICGIIWRLAGARLCIWNQRDEGVEGHRQPFECWAVRLTPLFVANSRACAEFVIQELGTDPAKVFVVPNGIALHPPAESRTVWKQRLDLDADAICICMVANLSDKKDHVTLLKAWRLVVDALSLTPVQLKLVLAGSYDGSASRLIDLVTTLGLTDYVVFLGSVKDVAGLLQAVDIGVYSSLSEGLPNGVLECMAMGKAVVATDISGIRAALGDGYRLLCQPGDPAEMAAHLLSLINNPHMLQSIAQQNRERAVACFGAEAMCRKMAEVMVDQLACGRAA